jgi:hypothetical protein
LVSFLLYVLTRLIFVLLLVPALFVGCFYGLVQLGFPPTALEVWALAIVGGSLVLVLLKPVEALWVKMRGPREAPELPGWARSLFFAGGGFLGLGVGSLGLFGALVFVSLGSWWKIPAAGPLVIGNVRVTRDASAGDQVYRVTFEPSRGARSEGAREAVLKRQFVGFEMLQLRFEGMASKFMEALGSGDLAYPGRILSKNEVSQKNPFEVGSMIGGGSFLTEKVLDFLQKIPGVTLMRRSSPFLDAYQKGGVYLGLEMRAGELHTTVAVPSTPSHGDPPPHPTSSPMLQPKDPPPDPSRPGPPVASPAPYQPPAVTGRPSPQPTKRPTPKPTTRPTSHPVTPQELATLYQGDPFEGLD